MNNNPILENFKNFYMYLIFWIVIAADYFLLLYIGQNVNLKIAALDSIVFNFLLAGMGLSFWYSAKYISFEKNNIVKIFLNHIIGGVLTSSIWLLLGYFILSNIIKTQLYNSFFLSTLSWRFLIGILFYFLITSFYYVIIYYKGFQERTVRESELKNLVTEAELRSLKFQINPHFIFNSLNSMSALTTIDPGKAKNMILKLADFLRGTLANNENQKSKLSEELRNIKLYLEIEKIRFEDKFEFIDETESKCLDCYVPSMILQPLVENAIKHAVYESLEKVILKLGCKKENEYLKIILENNFENENETSKGTGIGLKNISKRLEIIYDEKNLINIQKKNNLFMVEIKIPYTE